MSKCYLGWRSLKMEWILSWSIKVLGRIRCCSLQSLLFLFLSRCALLLVNPLSWGVPLVSWGRFIELLLFTILNLRNLLLSAQVLRDNWALQYRGVMLMLLLANSLVLVSAHINISLNFLALGHKALQIFWQICGRVFTGHILSVIRVSCGCCSVHFENDC